MSALPIPAGTTLAAAELTVDAVRERAKALVLRYVLTSSAILLIGGALGGILRQSQANVVTIAPTTWYELMTAHGLAAFVGWAAFCLMGVSFWILEECGFHVRGWGYRWAVASWWLMVLGVTGIVITVLAEHFAGSWVFLYPLPFHSASQWSEATAGFFSFSVILVGLSIFAYCFGILSIVTGSDLGARPGAGPFNRFMCAMGMGHVERLSKRYHTDRPLPFAVIPLTVIGIDMIIATAPLAVLLIMMCIQAFEPSVTVDPLLAKAMLWWFGHPVVYLLLFPAVAVYYHLIPRLAKRELVAGHIIAIAWAIAAITNVIIGFHHMYTDFPESVTQTVNTVSQPLTYAVTIPSAISLFSLGFTIYRSEFDWSNPAAKFLAAALASWVVAGFQGVALATIRYDRFAHNSLWVVGHFHNMALVHIGAVIFAAVYYFLPDLVGRPLHSRRLADWHLVLLLVGGYGMVVPWMLQGMDGAPRRFAVLESQYTTMSKWSLPFIGLIVVGTALFAYNVLRTLGVTWLSRAVGPRHLDDSRMTATPREDGSAVLASLVAAGGIAVALPSLWAGAFLWAPMGILAGFVAITLGARRQGSWTILVAFLLMVAGAVPSILGAL